MILIGLRSPGANINVVKTTETMFPMEMRILFGKWTKGYPFYIMAKNLTFLCPCPATLQEAEP